MKHSTKRDKPASLASPDCVHRNVKKLKQITTGTSTSSDVQERGKVNEEKGFHYSPGSSSTSAGPSVTSPDRNDNSEPSDETPTITASASIPSSVPYPSTPPPCWNGTGDRTTVMRDLFGDDDETFPEICKQGSSSATSSTEPHIPDSESDFTTRLPSSSSSPVRAITPSHQALSGTEKFTTGVKPRRPAHRKVTGTEHSSSPPVELIGGMPLIPGNMRRFKSSGSKSKGKGKDKES